VTFDVEVGGRRRRVTLTPRPDGWMASVDGRAFRLDATQATTWWSLLVGAHTADGGHDEGTARSGSSDDGHRQAMRSHEVAIDVRAGGELVVNVDAVAVPVVVIDPRAALTRRGHEHGGAGAGPTAIVAPMPGRVVKLLVAAGDAVAARQGLVVVEAMKMENELRAPKPGRVVEVRVTEGMSVEANAVLVVVE